MNDVNMPEERKNGGGEAPRNFKTKYSLGRQKDLSETFHIEKRQKWAAEALAQYPNKFPLIIERAEEDEKRKQGNQKALVEMSNPK